MPVRAAAAPTGGSTIEEMLERAEPTGDRPLRGLVERLAAEGRLREIVRDGTAVDPASLTRVAIRGVADDSRLVRPGDAFAAVPGEHTDGHDHAAEAIQSGAAALIVERPIPATGGTQLVVERSAAALASAAAWWYGDPSRELSVIGVTGTDGKTTTSSWSRPRWKRPAPDRVDHHRRGAVGPIRTATCRARDDTRGSELQNILRAMVEAGNEWPSWRRRPTDWPRTGSARSPTTWRSSRTSPTSTWSCTGRSRRIGPPS